MTTQPRFTLSGAGVTISCDNCEDAIQLTKLLLGHIRSASLIPWVPGFPSYLVSKETGRTGSALAPVAVVAEGPADLHAMATAKAFDDFDPKQAEEDERYRRYLSYIIEDNGRCLLLQLFHSDMQVNLQDLVDDQWFDGGLAVIEAVNYCHRQQNAANLGDQDKYVILDNKSGGSAITLSYPFASYLQRTAATLPDWLLKSTPPTVFHDHFNAERFTKMLQRIKTSSVKRLINIIGGTHYKRVAYSELVGDKLYENTRSVRGVFGQAKKACELHGDGLKWTDIFIYKADENQGTGMPDPQIWFTKKFSKFWDLVWAPKQTPTLKSQKK